MTTTALTPAAAVALEAQPADVLSAWLSTKAPGTRRVYDHALLRFGAWALGDGLGTTPASTLAVLLSAGHASAQRLVTGWAADLEAHNLAPRTVTRLLSSVSSLVRMARAAGLVAWNLELPTRRDEARHDRTGPKRGQVEAIVEHLEQVARGEGDEARRGVRDLAIIRLLHGAGLRRAEVCSLRVEDIAREAGMGLGGAVVGVRVKRKGRRELALVSIGPKAGLAIEAWLAIRGLVPGVLFTRGDRAAALSGFNMAMSGEAIRQLVARRAKEAGVKGAVRPHGLRHRGATDAVGAGFDALMAYGGWASPKSAMAYLDDKAEARARAIRRVEV